MVGLVGPDDVKDLQGKVDHYHSQLEDVITALGKAGKSLPIDASTFGGAAWVDLSARCAAFVNEASTGTFNPAAYIFAGSTYERGRGLIDELDKWRDHLADMAKGVASVVVPDPLPVPHSDIGLGGGMGLVLAAIVAILVLREMK